MRCGAQLAGAQAGLRKEERRFLDFWRFVTGAWRLTDLLSCLMFFRLTYCAYVRIQVMSIDLRVLEYLPSRAHASS